MEDFESLNAGMMEANNAALEKIKKYYSKFDDAHVYAIATSRSLLIWYDFDDTFLIFMYK